jgi:L-threonylcarbamoyladenylate synthase
VITGLGQDLDLVLDGGPCRLAQPSTILDLSGIEPKILRAGAIPETELQLPDAGAGDSG